MQPVWGIPSDRIQTAARRLKELAGGSEDEMWLYPGLFLCGMKYSLTRFFADQPAGHILDDGLNEAAKRALAVLIRSVKSVRMKQLLKSASGRLEGYEYVALRFAYLELEEKLPPTVSKWLQRGNEQENRCRLAIGMGANVLFDSHSFKFAGKLAKAKFAFINGENKDCREELKTIVEEFCYDPSWALPV